MYPQLSDSERISYPDLEQEVLRFWEENQIFERSVSTRPEENSWTFYEGPPTVNGVPGIHHVISRTLKDLFCRYQTMLGKRVHRRAGWDTHGLPVETNLEKQLGLKEKSEIETKIGVAEFNRMAKDFVYDHINREGGWSELTRRIGYWVNMDDAYITCTNNYIESVWWALKTLFDKGLIYRGFKVVPQCPHCETPLSSHEIAQGYDDVQDPNLYVRMKIEPGQATGSGITIPENTYFLVWTTTPWTLVSNVALATGPDIEYLLARDEESGNSYIFATARREALDPEGEWIIEAEFTGKDLLRVRYERLFDQVPVDRTGFFVTNADFVTTTDGTGVVHVAPAFGQDDYEVGREYDLPMIQPVTPGGRFTEDAGQFAGRVVKTLTFEEKTEEGVDKDIVINLKERGLVHSYAKNYLHSYPHCWRCDNPLIYYARDSWYIETTSFADRMQELNGEITWQTEEIGSRRFGNWLAENKDWSLSRDRYWGTPLPIWVNEEDPSDLLAIGSIEELQQGEIEVDGAWTPVGESGLEIDLHKPFVDRIIIRRDGKTYHRTPELIDVWFDSGSMPFAQWHYPFENRELFERHFPANYICEGVDQTRGWFYTLHAISTALFDSNAYRSVLVNDLVLDASGKKMSKSRGNVIDPFALLEQYGADAIRWYMVTSSPPWTPLTFREADLVNIVISDFFRALTNTYGFFALYANIDEYTNDEKEIPLADRPELDRWVLSKLNSLIGHYHTHMEDLDPTRAMRLVQEFTVEHLSNWYVRRNRRRFWKGEMSDDKRAAYQTLHEALIGVASLMAPLAPFLAERIYRSLTGVEGDHPEASIHLRMMPQADPDGIDHALERRMERAQQAVALARNLRERSGLKVRQPLRRLLVAVANEEEQRDFELVESIITEELNLKRVEYVGADDESSIVQVSAKPNFKSIGPKFGKDAKKIAAAIGGLDESQTRTISRGENLVIESDGDRFEITPDDVEIIHDDIEGWLVASDDGITVALDTELDDELRNEGLAREFVSRIQKMRKDAGLEVTDRIALRYETSGALADALAHERDYVMSEILAVDLLEEGAEDTETIEIDGESCAVQIEKA